MRLGVLLLVLGVLLGLGGPAAAERRSLTLVYDTNESWPWHVGRDTVPESLPGLSIEYLRETAKRLDIDLHLVRAPFRRALAMMQSGEADGVFEASFRPERLEFGLYPTGPDGKVDPSMRMFMQSYVFFVRWDEQSFAWDGKTISGLEGMIGVLRNTSSGADLAGRGYPIFEVGENKRALEMVTSGRLSAALLLNNFGTAIFSREPDLARSLRILSPPWEEKPYYLMLSHQLVAQDPAFAKRLWSELAAVAHSPFAQARLEVYEQALEAEARGRGTAE